MFFFCRQTGQINSLFGIKRKQRQPRMTLFPNFRRTRR
nr:MAG TPA: hypothetical protein [Caudoviricetes sp.]